MFGIALILVLACVAIGILVTVATAHRHDESPEARHENLMSRHNCSVPHHRVLCLDSSSFESYIPNCYTTRLCGDSGCCPNDQVRFDMTISHVCMYISYVFQICAPTANGRRNVTLSYRATTTSPKFSRIVHKTHETHTACECVLRN